MNLVSAEKGGWGSGRGREMMQRGKRIRGRETEREREVNIEREKRSVREKTIRLALWLRNQQQSLIKLTRSRILNKNSSKILGLIWSVI